MSQSQSFNVNKAVTINSFAQCECALTIRLFSGLLFFHSLSIRTLYFHMSVLQAASRVSSCSKSKSRCSIAIWFIFWAAMFRASLLTTLLGSVSSLRSEVCKGNNLLVNAWYLRPPLTLFIAQLLTANMVDQSDYTDTLNKSFPKMRNVRPCCLLLICLIKRLNNSKCIWCFHCGKFIYKSTLNNNWWRDKESLDDVAKIVPHLRTCMLRPRVSCKKSLKAVKRFRVYLPFAVRD